MLTGYLNYENTNDYQFIYTTLHKGSFYCLYIKLNKDPKSNFLESLDFFLQNYKGKKKKLKENSIQIEYDKKVDKILKIAFETEKGYTTDIYNESIINFDIKQKEDLNAIFVTRSKQHSSELKNLSKQKIIFYVNEVNYEGNEVFWEYSKSLNIDKKSSTLAAAVGRNCVTSYIKVNEN